MPFQVYLSVLDSLRETLKDSLGKALLQWVEEVQGVQRYNVDVIAGLQATESDV